jgi:hypothetical protein
MATPAAKTADAPFLKQSIIWQRKGPLPVWAWLIVGLAVVFVVVWWRRNRAQATADETATGYVDELPGDQSAPTIFVVPSAATPAVNVTNPITVVPHPATVPTAPPGGGSPPPTAPPVTPKPTPKPPGTYKTVVTYTSKNPPPYSTIWGMWNYWRTRGGTAANWQAVWSHPLNAALRKSRGAADRIRAGDRVFVPGAR